MIMETANRPPKRERAALLLASVAIGAALFWLGARFAGGGDSHNGWDPHDVVPLNNVNFSATGV
jgi:hypothetical protein